MSEVKEIRSFEQSDWWAWGGAERFSENVEPLILEVELDNNFEACIIADKNGIQIAIGNGGGEAWVKQFELSLMRAEGELRAIAKAIKDITYAPDLAYALDHPTDEALKGFNWIGSVV